MRELGLGVTSLVREEQVLRPGGKRKQMGL